MSLELRQSLKMSQQLVMTPQLQQAIKLLQLSRLELVDLIRSEINENPLLDEAPAFEGFALDTDHLAWSATGANAGSVVRVLAWNGEGMGIVELPSEAGGTVVR